MELTPRHTGFLRKNVANLITLGRIFFCLGSFSCAVVVLKGSEADYLYGFLGVFLLIVTALTDYFDGMVARRLNVVTKVGPLADQLLDKMVYCIIFPTISVGMMAVDGEKHINHVILSLGLCVTLLVRDHYVNFLRIIADRQQGDSGVKQIGKLRTLWALPTACILYGYCFCRGEPGDLFYFNAIFVWVKYIDVKYLIVLEISLFVINIVSAISYTRSYGKYFLNELCDNDPVLRRKILSIFPNALTCMNAVMGIIAVILAWHDRYHLSFVMLMAAAIFDKLDGAAARELGLVEEPTEQGYKKITVGAVLDDIADGISFCIAPAAIAWAYLQNHPYQWCLAIYALAGIARLIFFTFDKYPIPGFFKGLPSPAAALLTGGVVQAAYEFDPHAQVFAVVVIGVFLLLSFVMNAYFIPYVHFGRWMSKSKLLTQVVFLVMLVTMFSNYLGIFAIVVMLVYLCSPVFIKSPKNSIGHA